MSLSNHKLTAEQIHLQMLNLKFFTITERLHHPDFSIHLLNAHIFLKNQMKSQLAIVHPLRIMSGTKKWLKDATNTGWLLDPSSKSHQNMQKALWLHKRLLRMESTNNGHLQNLFTFQWPWRLTRLCTKFSAYQNLKNTTTTHATPDTFLCLSFLTGKTKVGVGT